MQGLLRILAVLWILVVLVGTFFSDAPMDKPGSAFLPFPQMVLMMSPALLWFAWLAWNSYKREGIKTNEHTRTSMLVLGGAILAFFLRVLIFDRSP